MTWLIVSSVGLLAAVAGLGIVLFSLARQIGVLHERTAPVGVLARAPELATGAEVPDMQLPTLDGRQVDLHAASREGRWTALLFIASDCPICKAVLPAYTDELDTHGEVLDGFWVSDGADMDAYPGYAAANGVDPAGYVISQELGLRLQIRQLPALVLIDAAARLVARQVVQSPRQLQGVFREATVGAAA